MSHREVDDDEHNLDQGNDGGPQQEDMEAMLCSLWHGQSNGSVQTGLSLVSGAGRQMLRSDECRGSEFPLLCTKAVCVCFLSSVCACDDYVLMSE